MEIRTKISFRVITPDTFCNLDVLENPKNGGPRKPIETIEEAQEALDQWTDADKNSEHYNYWQEQKAKCKIVRVTEIIEEDIKSNVQYVLAKQLIQALQTIGKLINL